MTKLVEEFVVGLLDKFQAPTKSVEILKAPPSEFFPHSEGWTEKVLGMLRPNEFIMDGSGNKRPRINGLRRLVEELIGTVQNVSFTVERAPQPPNFSCCVKCSIVIALDGYKFKHVEDIADVSDANLDDDYLIFPASVCASRAESRCYRKLLYLYDIVANEEMTTKTASSIGLTWQASDSISTAQINALDVLAKRLDINVKEFLLKGGEKPYNSVKELNKITAAKILEYLNACQQGVKSVTEELKGYQENWNS